MKRGFTIIELLIAVAISGLLMVGAISKFNNFNENQKVKVAAQKVRNDLRLVQSRAASGLKPTLSSGETCTVFDGYNVDFVTAPPIGVQGWCDDGSGCVNAKKTGTTTTFALPLNITMTLSSTTPVPTQIIFRALSRGITLTTSCYSPIPDLTITFNSPTATNKDFYKIVLYSSGDIDSVGF